MDHDYFRRGHSHLSGLGSRISKLRPRLARLTPESKRRARSLGLLCCALLCGAWAHQTSSREALWQWRSKNYPAPTIWKHALESQGYREILDAEKIHRILRSLSTTADTPGAVWADAEYCRLVVFGPLNQIQAARVFICPALLDRDVIGRKPGPSWKPLGQGWQVFESLLDETALRKTAWKPQIPSLRVSSREALDPREVRY
jgi:hypothetical protein